MVVFVGQITVSIGASAESKVDVVNVEKLLWKEVPQPSLKPVVVMNQVYPVAFHQLHKWIEAELHVKSEANAAVHGQGVDYLPAGLKAPACPYILGTLVGHDATTWTIAFVDSVFSNEEFTHGHDGEGITIYKFMAEAASLTPPA